MYTRGATEAFGQGTLHCLLYSWILYYCVGKYVPYVTSVADFAISLAKVFKSYLFLPHPRVGFSRKNGHHSGGWPYVFGHNLIYIDCICFNFILQKSTHNHLSFEYRIEHFYMWKVSVFWHQTHSIFLCNSNLKEYYQNRIKHYFESSVTNELYVKMTDNIKWYISLLQLTFLV